MSTEPINLSQQIPLPPYIRFGPPTAKVVMGEDETWQYNDSTMANAMALLGARYFYRGRFEIQRTQIKGQIDGVKLWSGYLTMPKISIHCTGFGTGLPTQAPSCQKEKLRFTQLVLI